MQTSTHRVCLVLGCALAARAAVAQAPQTIVVEGRKEPVEARSSLLGDEVPSAEVPWSVHVLRAGDFTRAADDRLESALSSAGLVAIGVNQAGLGTAVVARGFDLSTRLYVNGHPDLLRLFVRDLATVDRVEVLKGQYGLLYGQGSPGATINHVSKRPAGTGQVSGSVAFGRNYRPQALGDSSATGWQLADPRSSASMSPYSMNSGTNPNPRCSAGVVVPLTSAISDYRELALFIRSPDRQVRQAIWFWEN